MPDRAVPQPEQVPDHVARGSRGVGMHRGPVVSGHLARREDGYQRFHFLERRHVGHPGSHEDDPVAAGAHEPFHRGLDDVRVELHEVGDAHRVAGLLGSPLDAVQDRDRAEGGVGVGDDTEDAAAPGGQRLRHRVGPVTELRDRGLDPRRGLRAHERAAACDPGRRLPRDAGEPRDIGQGGAHGTSRGGCVKAAGTPAVRRNGHVTSPWTAWKYRLLRPAASGDVIANNIIGSKSPANSWITPLAAHISRPRPRAALTCPSSRTARRAAILAMCGDRSTIGAFKIDMAWCSH